MNDAVLTPPDTRDPNELLAFIGQLQHAYLALLARVGHADGIEADFAGRLKAETDRQLLEFAKVRQEQIQAIEKRYAALIEALMPDALRYRILRPHRVRCSHLNILSSGEFLDYQLDKLVRSAGNAQRNASLLMPGPPSNRSAKP